jgi:2-polyprenyl-6-methoxyphenol hydroxylase-like FAD-dependent oxidoreductase
MKSTVDIGIIGAGPTGLYLGIRLIQEGFSVQIWEKNDAVSKHSRSIGIHPPSLELFAKHGFSETFLQNGNAVLGGHVFSNQRFIGSLTFERCPKPFPFVLSLPQEKTEQILESVLIKITKDSVLQRGVCSISLESKPDLTSVTWKTADDKLHTTQCSYLIDASGKNSAIREQLGFSYQLKPYPDTYVMGDFDRETQSESMATIYLDKEGVIESFPLPNGIQRWVLKTAHFNEIQHPHDFATRIRLRTGEKIQATTCTMFSAFGVQKGIADSFVKNSAILCGDSAHVISPIGGQGMNIAWLDAEDLVQSLANSTLLQYEKNVRKRWENAVLRSEFNMITGRASADWVHKLKLWGVSTGLKPVFSAYFANQFTMRGV